MSISSSDSTLSGSPERSLHSVQESSIESLRLYLDAVNQQISDLSAELVYAQQDIARLEDENHRLRLDRLSGLLDYGRNRELIDDKIESLRQQDRAVGFLFIDGNNFGEYNKNYDVQTGDSVIEAIGSAIQRSLRTKDPMEANSTENQREYPEDEDIVAFRKGGDEFLVIVGLKSGTHRLQNRHALHSIAQRIKENAHNDVKEAVSTHDKAPEDFDPGDVVSIGATIGIPNEEYSVEELLLEADYHMRRDKRNSYITETAT